MTPKSKKSENIDPWHDPHAKPYIVIDNVSKSFDGVPAVSHTSLEIYKGEFFSLLGPSGCGKSTLLRMLAGFEQPDSGKIIVNGTDITNLPPYERPVNMMFQSYALFPHMSVEQNIAFGLKQEGLPKDLIADKVSAALNLVKMSKYANRRPSQLSGGQRQRVALARSLIKKPKLLLLDEPMAALDKVLREDTQFELVNIQEKVGITFIMVTHDQEEAMTMSTRMAVMEEGRVWQIGSPQEIYEYPSSSYVADFIGDMNMFDGVVVGEDDENVIIESDTIGCQLNLMNSSGAPVGAQVTVAIRPEKIFMSKRTPKVTEYNCVQGIVTEIAYLGDVSVYRIKLNNGVMMKATTPNLVRLAERPINWDDEVYLYWRPENGLVLLS